MSSGRTFALAVVAVVVPGIVGALAGRQVALRSSAPPPIAEARPAPLAADPPPPDPLPMATARSAEPDLVGKPGFFHLERKAGVWWFVDPSGKPFVSIGMNHLEPNLMLSQVNHDQTIAKYGQSFVSENGRPDMEGDAVRRWTSDAMREVRSWGFNTLGMHNPVDQREMPYVAVFRPAKIDSWQKKTAFPDPFDPAVAADVDRQAAAFCAPRADDRLILGYGLNDWVDWHTKPGQWNPWQRAIMALPATAPGKIAWVGEVRGRHPSIEDAAEVYGVDATTWVEFAAVKAWPPPTPAAQLDTHAFLPKLAHRWYGIVAGAVRKHDPNHLVLGDKIDAMLDFPGWMDGVVDAHFDMAYLQWFQRFPVQQDRLRQFAHRTGKPVLIGDSGFSTPTPWLAEPKPVRVASSAEVAQEYTTYLDSLMHEPYAIGWHWCGYIMGTPDLLHTIGKWPSKQYGFLDPDGAPHRDEIGAVRAANRSASTWHAEARPITADPTPKPIARGQKFKAATRKEAP